MFSERLILKARVFLFHSDVELGRGPALIEQEKEPARERGERRRQRSAPIWKERDATLNPNSTDQSAPSTLGTWRRARLWHVLASPRFNRHTKAQSLLFFFFLLSSPLSIALFFSLPLPYTRSSLILSLQIHPPVFSLVIKSCQAEVGLHSIIPRSSNIWCSPEESRHNTHHLLSAKYVGEFCRIFTQSHSVPFINYHITKEAHLLCMVCCLGARSNSPP